MNPALGLQYHGSVLNLNGFNGPIIIENSGFINFTLPYESCDVAQEYVAIDYSIT